MPSTKRIRVLLGASLILVPLVFSTASAQRMARASTAKPKPVSMMRPQLKAMPAMPAAGKNVMLSWKFPTAMPGTLLGCRLKVDHYRRAPNTPMGSGQPRWVTILNQSVSNTGQHAIHPVQRIKYRAEVSCNYKQHAGAVVRSITIPVRPAPIRRSPRAATHIQ